MLSFLYISRNETRRAAKDGDSRFTLKYRKGCPNAILSLYFSE